MEWFDTDTRVVSGIPFAVDSAGQWRDIGQVERGLKCGCFCAACNGPLVAKKGTEVIHHFAHHDRRECRHALEASLYGMVVEILTQPGAKIQLPGYIRRADWLWGAGIREGSRAYEAFLKSTWVIDPITITAVNGLGVNAPSLQQSKVDVPEFVDESAKLEIHLLTYLKKLDDFVGLPVRDGWTRLGLNLRYYTSLWWSTCDVSRGENVTAAMQARDRLQQWLGEEPTGRGILAHPLEAIRKEKFQQWAEKATFAEREKARAAQELQRKLAFQREQEERRWIIPYIPESTASKTVWQPIDSKHMYRITDWLAREMGLQKAPIGDGLAFFGVSGKTVPTLIREYLCPDGPWHPSPDQAKSSNDTPQSSQNLPKENEILSSNVGVCYCGAPIRRLRRGYGFWCGKIVEECSSSPDRHPMKIIGR